MKKNLIDISKGLYLDTLPQNQPKGTYRYALNMVSSTNEGSKGFKSTEEANKLYSNLSVGFTPIGDCYIGNNSMAVLSVNNDISEIGIIDGNGKYTVYYNDKNIPEKDRLGFDIKRQIQVEYRLRKGCERTIYFAGKGYPVRYFNFDKPDQFKINGRWNKDKFKLIKRIKEFPTVDTVEVLNSSGNLTPGSYTILVQHVDADFNGTEYYELVKNIIIYNDSLENNFSDIQGSSNIGEEAGQFKYSKTSKAIRIVLDKVDKNFTYVRFAFVAKNSGVGRVSEVQYSELVSTYSPVYTYTGDNAQTKGTIEEVKLVNANAGIESAESIMQIDNMLVLANVEGDQTPTWKLQKYASKIQTDCFVKDIVLTSIKDNHNPKNPLADYYGLGYQPGDIYSPGIIYIFEDYTTSNVFHIPGKSSKASEDKIYSPGDNVHPMSNINNENESEVYIDENDAGLDYWGKDCEGSELKYTQVRHHRFPTRDKAGVGFVKRVNLENNSQKFRVVQLTISGDVIKSTEDNEVPKFNLIVKYRINGSPASFQDYINPDSGVRKTLVKSNIITADKNVTDLKLYYQVEDGAETEIPLKDGKSDLHSSGLTFNLSVEPLSSNDVSKVYTVPIFGFKFSNVEIPPEEEIGKKVIGYQIVRLERKDSDKNIMDTGVMFPMQKSDRNVTTGLLAPEFFTKSNNIVQSVCDDNLSPMKPICSNVSKNNAMIVAPGHRFRDKTYDNFTEIEEVGTYEKEYVSRSVFSLQDVYEGSSATGKEDKKTDDDDGFSLRQAVRFTGVEYGGLIGEKLRIKSQGARMYNLQGVNYAENEDGNETLYNMSFDNKALILSTKNTKVRKYEKGKQLFPYVYIKKDNSTFYENFRNQPYYLVSSELFKDSECTVFGGDTYVCPMRYSTHVFGNAAVAMRRQKMNVWVLIGSIVIIALSIVLSVFSGGAPLIIAGAILAGLGATMTAVATVLETAKVTEIYGNKWEKGLDRTVFDYFYASVFIREYPEDKVNDKNLDAEYLSWEDDTFRWFGDIVGDMWFETDLNISLRVAPTGMTDNYLKPLKNYMDNREDKWKAIWHGVGYVSNNTVGNGRFHRFDDKVLPAELVEEWFYLRKITEMKTGSTSGFNYSGISTPVVYMVNPDHYSKDSIKAYYQIPLEYDIASKCRECFPHRYFYSQQSFQEETSDNYRVFLPNNYRDLEGESGKITNIFSLGNDMFIHTEEALWQQPRNFQERVTDQIVSFIGTGSYFEVPPRKIIDSDTGMSAGCNHKWSNVKTPEGIFFVCENERKIFRFDGRQVQAISMIGLESWFNNNISILSDNVPNNPVNPNGSGFVSTYDPIKDRVLFTKKDETDTSVGWTISYSIQDKQWISFHSYIPNKYFSTPKNFYSWKSGSTMIYQHNDTGKYLEFNGKQYPFIVDTILSSDGISTKTTDAVTIVLDSQKYDKSLGEFTDDSTFFNKLIAYNSRQCTGLMNIKPKAVTSDYLWNQVDNTSTDTVIVDRQERDWNLNNFRDLRTDYSSPVFTSNINRKNIGYYLDKEVNRESINYNKDWTEREIFRDKYFGIRLIFDTFVDTKLTLNFSIPDEDISKH